VQDYEYRHDGQHTQTIKECLTTPMGALTDKDLDTVDEKLDGLPVLLQSRYGHSREQAEKEIDLFLSSMKTEGQIRSK